MKAQSRNQRIVYSPDVDILMIVLSNKKVDDSYDTDQMIVQVDKEGEPVIVEIFNGKKFLKALGKTLPRSIKKELWDQAPASVAHKIK